MLTDYFPPHAGGGVERVVFELARTLVRAGLTVGVLTLNTNGAPGEEVLEEIRIWRVKGYALTRLLRLQSAFSPGVFRKALNICRTFAPNLIHAHNIFFATSLVGPVLKWKLRRPLVTSLHLGSLGHVPGIPGHLARLYEAGLGRWILNQSDYVLAVSESVRQHGLKLGVAPQRILLIPNAVDLPRRAPSPVSSSPLRRVVFVGRLVVNKGPHVFIHAAIRVLANADNVEFILVGDGPMRRPLESEVSRRGLASHIRFLGFRSDVGEILSSATLFVRPSLLEGYPLAVLEAMAYGVPVTASRIPGNTDLIQHGETGILTEAGDVIALAGAITALLGDAETRARLAACARAAVARLPGWDGVGRELINVYDSLLNFPSPSPHHAGQPV